MTQKVCPRCGRLMDYGPPYCADCRPIAEAEAEAAKARKAEQLRKKYNKAYNKRRDPKYLKFYRSKEWKLTSRKKLQIVGWKCEARLDNCTGLACEVHHKKPIQTPEGWGLRLDWDNLEAVCTACHNGRHAGRFKKKKDEGVIDLREIKR